MKLVSSLKSRAAAALAVVALSAGSPAAQAASVAYVNASGYDISYITGYGHTLTNISDPIGLTLASLSGYDVVIAASNSIFSEPGNIGDVLADFADAGGGVVLTEFTFQGVWALGGRIMTAGYSPFTIDPSSGGYAFVSALGTIFDPLSPLLTGTAGVTTHYQADVGLDTGASLVADWTSGRHAIAYNSLGTNSVVALNLFPGLSTGAPAEQLVANAIEFSLTGGSGPRVPDSGPGFVALVSLAGLFLARRRFGRN